MSQGTLYVTEQSRGILVRALIKHFNLDIKLSDKEDPAYKKNFPLGKIPTFIASDGFKLQEVTAILIYFTELANDKSLLGRNAKETALINQWLSFANSELIPSSDYFKQRIGLEEYDHKVVEKSEDSLEKVGAIFEEWLKDHPYLAGDKGTLADVFAASVMSKAFQYLYGIQWRKDHPHTTEWFKKVINEEILAPLFTDFKFLDEK